MSYQHVDLTEHLLSNTVVMFRG